MSEAWFGWIVVNRDKLLDIDSGSSAVIVRGVAGAHRRAVAEAVAHRAVYGGLVGLQARQRMCQRGGVGRCSAIACDSRTAREKKSGVVGHTSAGDLKSSAVVVGGIGPDRLIVDFRTYQNDRRRQVGVDVIPVSAGN